MNEVIKIVVACSAWVALCALACVGICAAVYTAKPEDK